MVKDCKEPDPRQAKPKSATAGIQKNVSFKKVQQVAHEEDEEEEEVEEEEEEEYEGLRNLNLQGSEQEA